MHDGQVLTGWECLLQLARDQAGAPPTVQHCLTYDKDLYANLLAQRDALAADLGFVLEWDDKADRKASKLVISRPGDFLDQDQSRELVQWLVTTGDAFARGLPKYL